MQVGWYCWLANGLCGGCALVRSGAIDVPVLMHAPMAWSMVSLNGLDCVPAILYAYTCFHDTSLATEFFVVFLALLQP
jgi:hypothetical protein